MSAKRLLELIEAPDLLVCPGVFDGITTRIAHRLGAKCLYMTGAGTVASRLGMPDLGIANLNDMHENAHMISGIAGDIPVIADADTGYGNSTVCARTLNFYSRAGVAALHVEDQILSKRCGHLLGKELVSGEEFTSRIHAMAIERKRIGSDILIIARTDALQEFGLEEALKRIKSAISVGADIAFVEGIKDEQQAKAVVAALAPTPVLINLVPNGLTPNWSTKEAQDLGFKLALYPGVCLGPIAVATQKSIKNLFETGKQIELQNNETKADPREFFITMGLEEVVKLDKEVGANSTTDII
ncbi:methylisocitrate lyase (2-methylisocitrate lyase) [Scheffersomyces stipitis CBS 6054]|uniref:Methylisocitrate lyase (2-methylisocitrate lyase) n=1 Tax=Scheffersomyces stipitis (strain ATCC 58785 / CBS 6054 / NBRC 10063 / NRRL Y-11545) TaxID=322104 RepID=A3LRP5_PICST|nr:methylisocitrate lyase (2-methylisocitrate lyase) [Scheffersomyces stipitis CBS 6054]ABN65421.1 methylisocitrate lyase (2-methylisocitrate lyase) [Scheffersomyces stipitis CBS 6054]